ncbi:MAG: aldo/keto reductase [Candidatus Ancillula sp.]|jgi:aryl-alcohol dehydrogenase-like predicted oxidoreductase|nr:aldo/keto reductase [Candidatus Ancillula sp.]
MSTSNAQKYRKLGPYEVLGLGLGCMPLSIEGRPSREDAISVIHRALDLGVNHLDTAFAYYEAGGTSENGEEQHNEKLIAQALRTYTGDKSNVVVASKVGHYRYIDKNGQPQWGQQADANYILETAKKSRDCLEVDSIDLYYHHRPDPNPEVTYSEGLEALAKLAEDGVVKYVGISNASIEQIDLALSILGDKLIAVQNQYSPAHQETLDTLEYTKKKNLAFLPWSPLGGFRNPELLTKDQPFEEVGKNHDVSKQQVILAWELAQSEHVIPIPGFRRIQTLEDSLKALALELTSTELETLNA